MLRNIIRMIRPKLSWLFPADENIWCGLFPSSCQLRDGVLGLTDRSIGLVISSKVSSTDSLLFALRPRSPTSLHPA